MGPITNSSLLGPQFCIDHSYSTVATNITIDSAKTGNNARYGKATTEWCDRDAYDEAQFKEYGIGYIDRSQYMTGKYGWTPILNGNASGADNYGEE